MDTEASDPFSIAVECYAGYRGEETPVRFTIGNRIFDIDEVTDRWLAPDHRYFKVRAAGDTYILRHNVTSATWELTLYERTR